MQITSTEYPLFYVHCAREVTLTRVKQTDLKRLRSGYIFMSPAVALFGSRFSLASVKAPSLEAAWSSRGVST